MNTDNHETKPEAGRAKIQVQRLVISRYVAVKYWLYIVWLAYRWIFQVNLGDYVWYKRKKYLVHSGVRCESWRLGGLDNGDSGWVPRKDCRKVLSFKNIIHSFKSGRYFYMTSWYSIWKRNGIENWCKSCHIWPGR